MAIGAFLALVAGLGAMAVGAAVGMAAGGMWGVFGAIFGFLALAYAVAAAATAYGLWTRKTWAWSVAVVLAALQILMALGSLVSMDISSALFGLVIGGVIVWYLFSPAVQNRFSTSYKVPWTYK